MENIPYSEVNLERLIQQGEENQNKDHEEKERTSGGNLRGGSAGCLTTDLQVIGGCHRISVLRALGINERIEATDRARVGFFPVGTAMEDKLAELLGLEGEIYVLREEECAVQTQTTKGRPITGRPDFIIYKNKASHDAGDDPILGVEFKTVCSASTASSVFLKRTPKTEHLCQAGFYMKEKRVPYVLLYWNPVSSEASYWDKKKGLCDWKFKFQPFRSYFYLSFKDDVLHYRDSTGREVPTLITGEGISNYYELVDDMIDKRDMSEAPTDLSAEGDKTPWHPCRYCAFNEACGSTGDFDTWIESCKSLSK